MNILETIKPLGHTIVVLDKPITTAADAQKWRTYLDFVSNSVEQRDAILVVPFADVTQAETFANFDAVKTSYRMVAACYHGATGQEPEIAASMAAALADSNDPAVPFNDINLVGMQPVDASKKLTRERIEAALKNGVAMIDTGAEGYAQIVRAISTYRKTPQGEDDDLMLDINAALIVAYVRKVIRRAIGLQPRRKNTIRTRANVRSLMLAELMKLDDAEILQNVKARQNELLVVEDRTDRTRANATIPADWVRGMHIVAATLRIY